MDAPFRIGIGTDRHRLIPGGPLILGNVTVPSDVGCDAHSDGDALLHAVTDALLGACGLPDIGEQFPDTDPAYAGADSAALLTAALTLVREQGYVPSNVDCVIGLERPKLKPYKATIARRIAELLGVPVSAVGIKAKTGEKLGPVGEGQAVDTYAVALVMKAPSA